MVQKTINVHTKEPPISPLQTVWWKPLFSAQKEASQTCKNVFSGFFPSKEFWEIQDEFLTHTHNQVHRIFGEIFNNRQAAMPWLMGNGTEPYMDITEGGKTFNVKAELPGVKEDDLKISITDGGLIIQGEKTEKFMEENEKTLHRECHYGAFVRTIALPEEADLNKAEANFEDSVLNIVIPKKAQESRKSHPKRKAA